MSVTQRVIDAPPEQVFAVLADGWSYSDWVVGTAHVRDVDPDWPRPGARLHHRVGPWPLSLEDSSVSLDWEPDRMLLMKVRLWPLGAGEVRMVLAPHGPSATRVTMLEDFVEGPLRWVHNLANDLVLHRRNVESLTRLGDLATHRVSAGGRVGGPS